MDAQKRIAINGASGRIGRAVTFELLKNYKFGDTPLADVVLINDPAGIDRIAESLAGTDPVHGKFDWDVRVRDDKTIVINDLRVAVFAERRLADVPFKDYGVDIVEECSGFFGDDKRDKTKRLSDEFFNYDVKRVIQSYPANADATLIVGVNHVTFDPEKHRLISNGSCTTKAIAAPLNVLIDAGISIECLLMDTVHAATNSQNILESLDQIATHKTGAARATGEVIPSLLGKMDGLSYRVPTTDGSFANIYIIARSHQLLTPKYLNGIFSDAVDDPRYLGRIGVFEGKEASTKNDIVGRTENGIVLLDKTRVFDLPQAGATRMALVGLVAGYDNERGPPADQVALTEYVARMS